MGKFYFLAVDLSCVKSIMNAHANMPHPDCMIKYEACETLDISDFSDSVRQFEDRYRGRYAIYCFGSKRARDSQYKRFRHKMHQEA